MARIIRYPTESNRMRDTYGRGYESRRMRNDYRGGRDYRAYGDDMAYNRRGYRNEPRNGGYESDYPRNYSRDNDRMGYDDVRQIGFDYDMRDRRSDSYMHGGGGTHGDYEIGHGQGMDYGLSFEEAKAWVESMKSADGSKGGKWKIEDVEKLLKERGLKDDPIDMWVGMNALYTDLCAVTKRYGIKETDVNFWVEAAQAFWLKDEDAVEDKLTVYFDCIVK